MIGLQSGSYSTCSAVYKKCLSTARLIPLRRLGSLWLNTFEFSHKASGLKVPTPSHLRQRGRVSLSYWGASWHPTSPSIQAQRGTYRTSRGWVNSARHVCKLSATVGSQLTIVIILGCVWQVNRSGVCARCGGRGGGKLAEMK